MPGISEPQDSLFVPENPRFGTIGLGGGLSPNFEPSPIASVEGFLASEQRVREVGMCIRCLKHLGSDKEQECVHVNSQQKCGYCAHLGKDCCFVPHCYRVTAQSLEAGPQDDTFRQRVVEFTSELDSHFRLEVRAHESTRALWSINRNLFRLTNTPGRLILDTVRPERHSSQTRHLVNPSG